MQTNRPKQIMTMKRLRKERAGYLFVLPQFILFAVLMVYPIFSGFRLSLYRISVTKETFVGLRNYVAIFSDPVFIKAIINTVLFVVCIVSLSIVCGIIISWAIYDKAPRYVAFVRGCYYIPVVVSMVVMTVIWNFLLSPSSGLVNYLLGKAGIGPVNFLGDARLVMPIIVFVTFVSSVGEVVVLYVAAMIGIPNDLFEAAEVDGAASWDKLVHIILPLVRSTSMYVIITKTIAIMKIFVVIQLLTNGGPNHSSVTLMFYLYEKAFRSSGKTGEAAAVGVVMFMVCALLSLLQYGMLRERKPKKAKKGRSI